METMPCSSISSRLLSNRYVSEELICRSTNDIGVLLRERLRSGQLPGLRCFRYLLVDTELEPGMAETIIARLFEGTVRTKG